MNFDKNSAELAYSFFHQKLRVFQYSAMEWQKDDIEYAVGAYADSMPAPLWGFLSGGNPDFLRSHQSFESDLVKAVDMLEAWLLGMGGLQPQG